MCGIWLAWPAGHATPLGFLRVGVHATCDKGQTLIPRAAATAGIIPGVRCGSGGGISYGASTGTARRRKGVPRATSDPPPWGVPDLLVSFSAALTRLRCPVYGVPGGSDQPDQPTCSLCAPPRAGIHCDTVGGQMALPPLP